MQSIIVLSLLILAVTIYSQTPPQSSRGSSSASQGPANAGSTSPPKGSSTASQGSANAGSTSPPQGSSPISSVLPSSSPSAGAQNGVPTQRSSGRKRRSLFLNFA